MWRWMTVCLLVNAMTGADGLSQPSRTPMRPAAQEVNASVLDGPETVSRQLTYQGRKYPLYPHLLDKRPAVPSPCVAEDGMEIVTALMKNNKYALMPVTVENGSPLLYSGRIPSLFGKDQQLHVDRGDFPVLAETGLHSEAELDQKAMITGIPVDVITYIGRPGRFSGAGFMAEDEDIIAVLKGDSDLVRKLGLTHPLMARPLFHVWNMILQEIACGKFGRFSNVQAVFYNERKVVLKAESTKGWQRSIFQDEVQGRFDIDVRCELTPEEKLFLQEKHSHLTTLQMTELVETLTHFHFSEMAPYYIMRYGFCEGHTDYRADPIAIACMFGLKSIEEIDNAFGADLHRTLRNHFAADN